MIHSKYILLGILASAILGCELYKSPGRRNFESLNVYKIHIGQTELLCQKLKTTSPYDDESCSYAENVFLYENTQCSSPSAMSEEEASQTFTSFCDFMREN